MLILNFSSFPFITKLLEIVRGFGHLYLFNAPNSCFST